MALTGNFSKNTESFLFRNQQNAADLRQREDLQRAFPVLEGEFDSKHWGEVSNAALVGAAILLIAALGYLIGRTLIAIWQQGGQH